MRRRCRKAAFYRRHFPFGRSSAPHKGTRRSTPWFFGENAAPYGKNGTKNRRLSKMPSRSARDKGCERRSCTTYNAACGIETPYVAFLTQERPVAPHTMLRAALKLLCPSHSHMVRGCTTYNAACGIETHRFTILMPSKVVAPHTMLRAALKLKWEVNPVLLFVVAPHTMLRAALKPSGLTPSKIWR